MPLILLSHLIGRLFGFRHRAVSDELELYRTTDFIGALLVAGIVFGVGDALASLAGWLAPAPVGGWLRSALGLVAAALGIFVGTLWMPLLEHLSLLQPGDLRADQRRLVAILARTIPYVYGFAGLLLGALMGGIATLVLAVLAVGLASVLPGPDLTGAPRWLLAVPLIPLWVYLSAMFLKVGCVDRDWGLPMWATFVEPGQQRGAGARLFDPLDRTLGRFVTKITSRLIRTTPEQEEIRPVTVRDMRRLPDGVGIRELMICTTAAVLPVMLVVGVTSLVARLTGWPLMRLFGSDAIQAGQTTSPAGMAGGLILCLVMVGALVLSGAGLTRLAEVTSDRQVARRRAVRWLAYVCRGLSVVADVLFGFVCGVVGLIILALLAGWARPDIIVQAVVFTGMALAGAWSIRQMPDNGAMATIIANVQAAQAEADRA